MSISSLAPVAVAAAVALLAGLLHRRLHPEVAALSLTVACVAVAGASVWALLTLVLGALVEIPFVHQWSSWCPQLYRADRHTSAPVGLTAGLALSTMAVRAVRSARSVLRTRRRLPRFQDGVLVIDSDGPSAYAVPGRDGGIVVSTGMIDALEPQEQVVLWAHERSHLAHHHHRYLIGSEMAVAIVPPLRRLADQVCFATERWADEDAARAVGGDRSLVARAIARGALATTDQRRAAMALAETGVGERVRAMVAVDRRLLTPLLGAGVGVVVMTSTLAGSGFQLHHLVTFVAHVCRGS